MVTGSDANRGLAAGSLTLGLRCRRSEPLEKGSPPSLFARLSPSVVEDLSHGTPYSHQQPNGFVEFLPLSVTFDDNRTIYVSYNGGEVIDAEAEEIIDLPASMIPSGISDGATVEVAVLLSLEDTDAVSVEPLTYEDWELLETGAQFLEGGALLQQVTVVFPDQILPLWVGRRDIARVRVLPASFQKVAVWPTQDTGKGNNSKFCCRLAQDTKFIVAPKTRHENGPNGRTQYQKMRVYPTKSDYCLATDKLAESLGVTQVSTSPGTVVLNPSARQSIPGLDLEDSTAIAVVWNAGQGWSNESSGRSCILQVVFSDWVPTEHVAVHVLTRARLDVAALTDSVFLRVLSPIEMARAHDKTPGAGRNIVLSKVEFQEARTDKKWRYPSSYQACRPYMQNVISENDDCVFARLHNEPVEDNSFLLNTDEKDIVYQASHSASPKPSFAPSTEDRQKKNERWFVSRRSLLPQGGDADLRKPSAATQTINFELRSSSQLVNLLPEESHIPDSLLSDPNVNVVGDAIVHGAAGSGKSHTALVLAAFARFQSHSSTFYLDCKRLKEGKGMRIIDIQLELGRVFQDASSSRGNSVVILDDLDELSPNFENVNDPEVSAQSQQQNPTATDQARLIGELVRRNLEVDSNRNHVRVVITCRNERSILPCIRNARSFTRVFGSPILNASDREVILWNLIFLHSGGNKPTREAFKSRRIGKKTEGFRPQDLVLLAAKVRYALNGTGGSCSSDQRVALVEKSLEAFVPLRQLSVGDEANVGWSHVGGLFSAKEALTSTIVHPARYRRIYAKASIRLPRGVMVFGSPGCGKSLLIPALAKECGFSLVFCRGPELLDRYIGASERKVRELFARAAASSPAILFFDEFDALAPRRGSDRTGVTDRVVNQMLTLLDGVEDSHAKGQVYVVAATSRPDVVDPALLRPGRLEKHIHVGSPENDDEYTDLLLKISKRYPIDDQLEKSLLRGEFVREAKSSCTHFERLSSADFKAAFDSAKLNVIHDLLRMGGSRQSITIQQRDFLAALHCTKPSLPDRDHAMLKEIYKPFLGSTSDGTKSLESAPRTLRTALR